MTDACPAAVQVLATTAASMHHQSVLALRNRVLVNDVPLKFVITFRQPTRSGRQNARRGHGHPSHPKPPAPSPPPPQQQQYASAPA